MDIRAKVAEVFIINMADVFMLDEEYITANPDLNFKEDLAANSIKYFPLLAALEDELGIEISLHDFQNEGKTVSLGIDYVTWLYKKQKNM